MHQAALVAQSLGPIFRQQERAVEIDHARALGHGQGRRHAERPSRTAIARAAHRIAGGAELLTKKKTYVVALHKVIFYFY